MRSRVQTRFVGTQLTSLGKEVGRGQKLSQPRKRRNKEKREAALGEEAASRHMLVQKLLGIKTREIPTAFSNAASRVAQENRLRVEEKDWVR